MLARTHIVPVIDQNKIRSKNRVVPSWDEPSIHSISQQVRSKSPSGPWICDVCRHTEIKKFGNFQQHLRTHVPKDKISVNCHSCGGTFTQVSALKRHQAIRHGVELPSPTPGPMLDKPTNQNVQAQMTPIMTSLQSDAKGFQHSDPSERFSQGTVSPGSSIGSVDASCEHVTDHDANTRIKGFYSSDVSMSPLPIPADTKSYFSAPNREQSLYGHSLRLPQEEGFEGVVINGIVYQVLTPQEHAILGQPVR